MSLHGLYAALPHSLVSWPRLPVGLFVGTSRLRSIHCRLVNTDVLFVVPLQVSVVPQALLMSPIRHPFSDRNSRTAQVCKLS